MARAGGDGIDVAVEVLGAPESGGAPWHDMARVLDAVGSADGHPPLSDQAVLDVQHPTPRSALLLARTPDGTLAAVGSLRRGPAAWTLEVAVDLPFRRPSGDVEQELLDAALAHVATHGGGRLALWVRPPATAVAAAATRRGLVPSREMLQLRVGLPLAASVVGARPGPPVRSFVVGADEAEWLGVNNRAFAAHTEQGAWSLDDLLARETEAWFDPSDFLVHEIGGRIVAFCWTKVHPDPAVGEIYVIGVDPQFQGRGLGRAMTVAGLAHLASVGVTTGLLYVESDNAPALALYRSLGFERHHSERQYTADVR